MSEADQFVVAGIKTVDGVDAIEFIFEDQAGSRRAVVLPRPMIPPLISLLQSKTEAGSVTPINRGSVVPGQSFAVAGFQPIRSPDGSVAILFYLTLPDQDDRGVTLPVSLTPAEARDLALALNPP